LSTKNEPVPRPPAVVELGRWTRLGAAIAAHPRRVIVVVTIASALAGIVAGLFLRVRPGYVDLLDEREPTQRRYRELLDEVGNVESLAVVVESTDEAAAGRFVDRFAPAVAGILDEKGAPRASLVISRVDPSFFAERLPAYLPAPALEEIAALPDLDALVADPSLPRILAEIRARLAAEAAAADPHATGSAGTLAILLDGMASAIEKGGGAESVIAAALPGQGADLDAAGHLRLGPGRLLVTVMPADAKNDYQVLEPLVRDVRDAAKRLAEPGVSVKLTGAPVLIVDEMRAVRGDVALASMLSFVLVTLLFFVSFDALRHVVFAAIANACGLALTFGAAYLLVGYLNLFSSIFAAVLAGLGIDFGVHFISHYEARRRHGEGAELALSHTYGHVVPPIAVSALITAAAFLTVSTSAFAGFSQLGVISAVGVVLCLVTAFTLVPALLSTDARRRAGRATRPGREPWSSSLLQWPVKHARVIAPLGLLLVLAAAVGSAGLKFDHDLMNLQPGGTEAVALQRDASGRHVDTHPAIALARSVEEARELSRRFRERGSVARVASPADALPEPDAARPAALAHLAERLEHVAPAAASPVRVEDAREQAAGLEADLVALQDLAFEGGDKDAIAGLDAALAAAGRLRKALDAPEAAARLGSLRDDAAKLLGAMIARLPALSRDSVRLEDLPDALESLVGRHGRIAVVVTPKESTWNRPALERFVGDVTAVDPEITGPAIQVATITELMRTSLLRCSALSIGVITLLVLLSTRSVTKTVLSLVPLLSGFVLMLWWMRLLGVPLNPANLVALPLLLGIGVDAGVHLIHGWREQGSAAAAVDEVGHALLITSLTTVAGFVPLLLARHHGIRSLGAATCLGSLGMLLAATVLMPAFLAVLDKRAARSNPEPPA
jgi:hopanoid biosynthesis associated RND transporter like protein HpnN